MVEPRVYRFPDPKKGQSKDYKFPGLTDVELGWLAGIIDGEGYITLRLSGHTKHHPQINVTSTCLELLETLKEITATGSIVKRRTPLNPKHSQAWQWATFRSAAVYGLCDVLQDLLIVKREKVQLILETFRNRMLIEM
jgi:hypothetical protein